MLTVLQAINLSEEYLKKKGVESARINAELLLADLLKCKRLDLYLSFDRPLSEKEKSQYRSFLSRRGEKEPLQYILGHSEFFRLDFKVNPSVLIPRPETEILVETIIKNHNPGDSLKILDIGTGSGNIAISLSKNLPKSKVIAIDISENAIKLAKENAKLNEVENRTEFINFNIETDNLNVLNVDFDIVVSNPPYVALDEFENLQQEIKHFEPKTAVTDFKEGFKFYKIISKLAPDILKNGGSLYFEVAEGQSPEVEKILAQNKFINIGTVKDYSNINRVVNGVYK